MKIAIVTDSTAYLSRDEVAALDIKVMPIPVIIDGTVYREGIDLTTDEFYEKLATSASFPSTSQPAVGEWITLFESLQADGYDGAIVVNLAATISGTVNTVAGLTDAVPGFQVFGYDSKITVRLMGHSVMKAAQMAQNGAEPADIIATMDEMATTMDEYFIVDDLQNLVRGGRLSNASAIIGTMLKVKPILTFDNDSNYIVPFEKVRSMKKAMARAEELFDQARAEANYPLRAMVIHANAPEAGAKWRDELQQRHPDMPFELTYFGPVIGTHLGAGALALAWIREPDSL
ncbi:DegV family protein [Weissella cibaria]|uniref:DegV family protein n=1 Tax=Weissella cibaria TaxID=137591 RepID=UPI001368C440|nr:DegV family protein [Weissella cibaria]MYV35244.1 DegV family EDD domain-containing protein [Weissella cibaria]